VLIKLKRIPHKHKEKYYLELREENIKTIKKKLITRNNEIRKAESLDNIKLTKRFAEKLIKHIENLNKYSKHTQKICCLNTKIVILEYTILRCNFILY